MIQFDALVDPHHNIWYSMNAADTSNPVCIYTAAIFLQCWMAISIGPKETCCQRNYMYPYKLNPYVHLISLEDTEHIHPIYQWDNAGQVELSLNPPTTCTPQSQWFHECHAGHT